MIDTEVIGRHKGDYMMGDKVIVNLFIYSWKKKHASPLNPALEQVSTHSKEIPSIRTHLIYAEAKRTSTPLNKFRQRWNKTRSSRYSLIYQGEPINGYNLGRVRPNDKDKRGYRCVPASMSDKPVCVGHNFPQRETLSLLFVLRLVPSHHE